MTKLIGRGGKLIGRGGKLVGRSVPAPVYFEMVVKTDNTGTSNNNQFTIPTFSGGYNYTVETEEQLLTGRTGDTTLEWASAGTYWVRITGDFPRIHFNNSGDRLKLLEVSNWGNIVWSSMQNAFWGCSNFNVTANDVPNLSNVTDMSFMFRDATAFNGDISSWNVSNVTDMGAMFMGASAFNGDISSWNVSNVTTMEYMFFGASAFNRDLSGWCVEQIASEPSSFDSGATSWVLPRPNWGDPC